METANWFKGPVIVALVVGLIAGFALGTYTAPRGAQKILDKDSESEVAATTSSSGMTSNGEVSFQVVDQPAGSEVFVSDLKLDKSAWVTVRKYEAGKLGYALGAYRLPAGTYEAESVDLIQPMDAGKTYAVTVLYDDGDKMFDADKDVVAEKDGLPLVSTFIAK